jgi:hypothetical protein
MARFRGPFQRTWLPIWKPNEAKLRQGTPLAMSPRSEISIGHAVLRRSLLKQRSNMLDGDDWKTRQLVRLRVSPSLGACFRAYKHII